MWKRQDCFCLVGQSKENVDGEMILERCYTAVGNHKNANVMEAPPNLPLSKLKDGVTLWLFMGKNPTDLGKILSGIFNTQPAPAM